MTKDEFERLANLGTSDELRGFLDKIHTNKGAFLIDAAYAVIALSRRHPEACNAAEYLMLALLDDERVSVRRAAICALERLNLSASAFDKLSRLFTKEPKSELRRAARRVLIRHWIRTLVGARKPDASAILGHLQKCGVSHLYHITSTLNVSSIYQHGGIFSQLEISRRKIEIPAWTSDKTSHEADKVCGTTDFVRLCFHPNQPMFFNAVKWRSAQLSVFDIDMSVASEGPTLFADENSVGSLARIGPSLANLEAIDLAMFQRGVWKGDNEKKLWQAEVLVHKCVTSERIIKVRSFSEAIQACGY